MKLRYTLPALSDLAEILDTVAEHSPQGARNVQRRIQIIIDLLLQHPLVGQPTDDPAIRRMNVPPYPYLVFYEAQSEQLIVHAVRHAARDPASMPGSDL